MVRVSKEVWVVIPAFNEGRRIDSVLGNVKKVAENILVVDDGSSDDTAAIAEAAGVEVIVLEENKGKGFALRKGCDVAVEKGAKQLVTLDADGQHDPSYIPRLVEKLDKGHDVCFTYRKRDKNMPWTRALGNWGLNLLMRVLFGKKPRDMLCGFIAYTEGAYKKLRWQADRYGVETELTANCLRNNLDWAEVEIPTIYLDKGKGVKLRDAIEIALFMVKLRFRRAP